MNEQRNECKGPGCQIPLTYGGASITSSGLISHVYKNEVVECCASGMKCEER